MNSLGHKSSNNIYENQKVMSLKFVTSIKINLISLMQDLMLKFCGSDDSAFADLGERIDLIKNLDELTLA